MTERLLQFIWQFQYFNKSELATTNGEVVQILNPGQYNTNQGPDFSDAKIIIGNTIWAGSIELHIKTSDWQKHHHQRDNKYKNVILHVVWEDDLPNSVNSVPVLELKDKLSKLLLNRYEELMNSSAFIPCEKMIHNVRNITWASWKERLLAERLQRKSKEVEEFLKQNNYHWEETFWWILARNFGMKVNAAVFEEMARSIPLQVLAKHKNQIHQLEAILLGQAHLLEGNYIRNDLFGEEDYPSMLQREYQFYKRKYKLRKVHMQPLFLRMRPGNFPTIRLAQLAMLIHDSVHLFSRIKEADSVNDVKKWMDVTANDYWHYHYRFYEPSAFKMKKPGSVMIENIIINTVAPVLFAFGNYQGENKYKDKALQWLEDTAAESNSITKGFHLLSIENKNAYDSQSLIELKNEYCNKKRCLECSVGNAILKTDYKSV